MKRSIYTSLFLCFAQVYPLLGQVYSPFPVDGTWIYQQINDFGQPTPVFNEFNLSGDTIIEGRGYRKLSLNAGYYGALRDSSERIYFRPAADEQEHLLYDFNISAGDTLVAPFPLEGLGYVCDTLVAVSEDQFLTSDGFRRRLNLSGCNDTEWIEGIGNTDWLTHPAYLQSLSGENRLTCFYESGQLIYALPGSFCLPNRTKEADSALAIRISPNPTIGLLTLDSLPDEPFTVTIRDLSGKELMAFAKSPSSFDLSALPDGIYLLTFKALTARKIIRIVKAGGF